jgi:putative flippase GtrA
MSRLPTKTIDRRRTRLLEEVRRAVKYGMVGVMNVGIDFALYAILVSLGVWYPIAKTLSLTVATGNGYTLNRLWTFRAGPHQLGVLARYVGVQAACLVLNVAVLALLVEVAGLHAVAAQALAVPFIAACAFLGQRTWTFREALAT